MTTPTRQITGTFLDSRLSPAAGKKIKLIPQEHRTDTVTKVLLDGDAVEVTLDVNGKIPTSPPVLVVCSDATGVEPHPVAYVLQKLFGDRERTLPFNIPAGSGPLDLADVVPLASAPTPAVSYWTAAQTAAADAAVLAAAEAYTDAHGGQVTKAAVIGTGVVASDLGGMTSAQINTAITTAVNNLLNGAPGALDTLRELADAINDDASFAATVTTALAGKAPIATTTIDLVDRTNNTTETVPAGTTTNCSTAGVTKTAPALDNPVATPPKRFAVKNISTGSITVAYPDQAGSAQSLTMLTGETRTFRQKSTSGWGVESGALALSTLDGRFAPITGSAAYAPIAADRGGWTASFTYAAGDRFLDPYGLERLVTAGYTSGTTFGATDTAATSVLGVAARTRRTIAVLSTPTNSTVKNAEICFRLSMQIPQPTTRWRLRIRNYQVFSEAAISTGASFVGVYHGPQAMDSTGQPTAGFASAPVSALGAFTLPSDGSEYISGWVTGSTNQISSAVPWLMSFAYTGGDTVTGQASGSGQMWYQNSVGSSANVGQQAASGFSTTVATPFDIRIEYETVTTAKIGLAVGDSLTWGTGPGSVPGRSAYSQVFGQRTGNPVTNAGVPSSTVAAWAANTTAWKWQRLVPANGWDFATVLLGTNDITSSNLATVQANLLTVWASLRTLGVGKVVGVTIPPRNWSHGRVAAYHAVGVTTLTLQEPTMPAGSAQIGEGTAAETVTISGSGTVSGTASGTAYTYTISSATTKTHGAGEVVASGNEITRLSLNAWLQGAPGGVNGVASVDRLLAAPFDKSIIAPELAQSDGLHLNVAGSGRAAEALVDLYAPAAAY